MSKQNGNERVVLITGSSRGIGYATVKLLALLNFKVYAGVRRIDNCQKLQVLADRHKNIIIKEIDLEKTDSIKKFTIDIKKKENKIDVVINNASTIFFGPIETISPNQFQNQFQINLFGPLLLTQELIPLMREKRGGHIIFIGSTSGIESHGMYGAYAATKFALEAVSHSLAVNLYPWDILVSIIELSATKTAIVKDAVILGSRLQDNENPYLSYTKNTLEYLSILLENGSSPDEIAEAIVNNVLNPHKGLRSFATQKARDTFERLLKDPINNSWEREAKESINFCSEFSCHDDSH